MHRGVFLSKRQKISLYLLIKQMCKYFMQKYFKINFLGRSVKQLSSLFEAWKYNMVIMKYNFLISWAIGFLKISLDTKYFQGKLTIYFF